MELNKEDVATMARSEAQFVRTNSGDAVYVFVHEGLLRFADKMAQYTERVMLCPALPATPQQLAPWPWQTQPQPDLTKGFMARIAELEAKLLESSESVINIGRECDHWKAKAAEIEIELQAVRLERNQYKSEYVAYKSQCHNLIGVRDTINADNTRLCEQVALIAGDRDKCNRRIVDLMAERDNLQRKVEAIKKCIEAGYTT